MPCYLLIYFKISLYQSYLICILGDNPEPIVTQEIVEKKPGSNDDTFDYIDDGESPDMPKNFPQAQNNAF